MANITSQAVLNKLAFICRPLRLEASERRRGVGVGARLAAMAWRLSSVFRTLVIPISVEVWRKSRNPALPCGVRAEVLASRVRSPQ